MDEKLLSGIYVAVDRRDFDRVAALLAPEASGRVIGRSRLSGDYHGPREVAGLFGRMVELSDDTLRYEINDLMANDRHGIALVRAHAVREDRVLDLPEAHLFHRYQTENGPVFTYWPHPSDPCAFDAFWS
jgi:hypothetical protein